LADLIFGIVQKIAKPAKRPRNLLNPPSLSTA
jgi:hypothetical protein